MKKLIKVFLVLTMVLALTACGSNGDSNDDSKDQSKTINITGSTSVEKILLDMADDYTANNPDVKINYTGTGSSAGLEDAINGRNDIGVSSRELKEEEKAELATTVFAYDGIAVIVNPANGVDDLTVEQILKIYSGEITNWSEVGGDDSNINVVSREGSSGTRSAFEELTGLEDVGLTEDATVVEGNGTVQTTIAGDANAIGYVSFSFIDDSVKAVTVDGAQANSDEVKAGNYPLSRPFLFGYKEEDLSSEAKAFIEFTLTSNAQIFVDDHGGITVD